MKFEVITFYNLSVYHRNLHDKQSCIIVARPLNSLKIILYRIEGDKDRPQFIVRKVLFE